MKKDQLSFVYVMLILLNILEYNSAYYEGIIFSIISSLFAYVLFIYRKENVSAIKNIYFRPIHIFIFAYLIVFFQYPLDYIFGLTTVIPGIGGECNLIQCVSLSAIGLLAFLLGYLNICNKEPSTVSNRITSYCYYPSHYLFTALSSIMIVAVYIFTPMAVLMGGYGSEFTAGGALVNYLLSWTNTFIIAALVQHYLQHKDVPLDDISIKGFIKQIGWWQNTNILVYCLTILNIGDRGPIIIIATAYYLILVLETHKCPSKKMLVSILTLSVVFVSMLGYTKKLRDNNSIFDRIEMLQDMEQETNDKTISPYTAELAGSYQCLSYSIFNVPNREDYKYGGYQFSYLWGIVPFGSHLIKTIGTSSSAITYYIQGPYPTHGNGSSCIADLYLDGGLFAVFLGMLFFGLSIRRFEYELFCNANPSIFMLCCAIYLSAHAIYIPRAMIFFFYKYAVWMFVILFLYNKNYKKVSN